jgi:hypothetical protein
LFNISWAGWEKLELYKAIFGMHWAIFFTKIFFALSSGVKQKATQLFICGKQSSA